MQEVSLTFLFILSVNQSIFGFYLPEVIKQVRTKPSAQERTCACTQRVFLAEVERKRLSENLAASRDERDKLKIEVIDFKQETLELKSKVEFFERNTAVLAKDLTESNNK